MCPNEMVPLQIDLAVGSGRYLFRSLANPARADEALAGELDTERWDH
jgi:hypothetical protein